MIKDVDPMLDNITVQGRCISLWHSHRLNEAHNPYSLDMVLQDSHNSISKFISKRNGCFGLSRCSKKASVILSPTFTTLKTVMALATITNMKPLMSLVLLWQSEMLSLYNLLLAERYEGLLLSGFR
nr:replication protein A 70 kDa DNA-binding subunit B [Tanacetum cinerariifolium]